MIFGLGLSDVPSWSDRDNEFLAEFHRTDTGSFSLHLVWGRTISVCLNTESAIFYHLINMLSSREILWDSVKSHSLTLFYPLVLSSIDFSCLNYYNDTCQIAIFLIPSFHLRLLVGLLKYRRAFSSLFLNYIYNQCKPKFIQWIIMLKYIILYLETQKSSYLGTLSSWLLGPFNIFLETFEHFWNFWLS